MNAFMGMQIVTNKYLPVDLQTKLVIERPFWRRMITGRLHDYRDVESHRIWFVDGSIVAHPKVVGEIRNLSI